MRIWLFHTVINDNIGNYCQLGFLESTLLLLEDKAPLLKFQIAVMLICAFCLWQFFFLFFYFFILERVSCTVCKPLWPPL